MALGGLPSFSQKKNTMARIRSYNPEMWTNEQLVNCSLAARLLWLGIQSFADDAGVLPARAMTLKMQIFPGDAMTPSDVTEMLQELEGQGLIVTYTAQDGQRYLQVQEWHKLQKIDKPSYKHPVPAAATQIREKNINAETQKQAGNHTFHQKSGYDLPSSSVVVAEHSANSSRTLGEHSPSSTPRSGGEWKGMERKGGECESAHTPAHEAESSTMEVLPSGSDAGSPPEWGAAPPSWMEVAQEMIQYFTADPGGIAQWEMMEVGAGGRADPAKVCVAWAGKASPLQLQNWATQVGKLATWVQRQAVSDRNDRLKTEKIDKHAANNGHLISEHDFHRAVSLALAGD